VRVAVVGSINLDLVVRCERLPWPGETVSGGTLTRYPGGKGANQAVAAARLGADVCFVGAAGRDDFAEEAMVGLREEGVDVSAVRRVDAATGVAVILVAEDGENQIVVAPGANALLSPTDVDVGTPDAVICQLEIPDEVVLEAARQARFLCLNAAPARPIEIEPDLLVVNRLEREVVGDIGRLTAVTLGAEGAVLVEDGDEVARAAGDAFTACIVVSLLEGRSRPDALSRACAAGALAASRPGAQPSLPTALEIDAILRA
jgi:ribokinase